MRYKILCSAILGALVAGQTAQAAPPTHSLGAASSNNASSSAPLVSLLSGDGTFTSGIGDFYHFIEGSVIDSSATFNGVAQFNIPTKPLEEWHIGLSQNVVLKAGVKYTACYDAMAAKDRSIHLMFLTFTPTFDDLSGGGIDQPITRTWASYKFTFVAAATFGFPSPSWDSLMVFNLGSEAGNVSLDNIGLYEGDSCPAQGQPGGSNSSSNMSATSGGSSSRSSSSFSGASSAASSANSGSLLSTDGTFSNGAGDFLTYIPDLTNSVSFNGAADFSIITPTQYVWQVQIAHPVAITAGVLYSACFSAKAAFDREITLGVDDAGPTYLYNGGWQVQYVTPLWTDYKYSFVATETDATARLVFNLGGYDRGTVSLDNISVYEGGECPASQFGGASSSFGSGNSSASSQASSASWPSNTSSSAASDFSGSSSSWSGSISGNLLSSDGTFSNDAGDFSAYVGFWPDFNNSVDFFNGAANFSIVTPTPYLWQVQLAHPVALRAGVVYSACFSAKAAAARSIILGFDENGTPGYAYLDDGGPLVSLVTTQWQDYQYTFVATATDDTARLVFSLGMEADPVSVSLDNISVYEGKACPGSNSGGASSSFGAGNSSSASNHSAASSRSSKASRSSASTSRASSSSRSAASSSKASSSSRSKASSSKASNSSRSIASSSKAASSSRSTASSSKASNSSRSKASSSKASSSSRSIASSSKASSSSSSSSKVDEPTCGSNTFTKTAVKGTPLNVAPGDCIKFNKVSGTLKIGSWGGKLTKFDISFGPQGISNNGNSLTVVAGVANGPVYIKVKSAPSKFNLRVDS